MGSAATNTRTRCSTWPPSARSSRWASRKGSSTPGSAAPGRATASTKTVSNRAWPWPSNCWPPCQPPWRRLREPRPGPTRSAPHRLRPGAPHAAAAPAARVCIPHVFSVAAHAQPARPARRVGREPAWLDELLRTEGVTDATGEVWLHCYPRVLGYTFKPVSFWYCHRADGHLRAIVVEVNNTFGERHCYLLDAPQYGVEQQARKVFHVSPFCEVN